MDDIKIYFITKGFKSLEPLWNGKQHKSIYNESISTDENKTRECFSVMKKWLCPDEFAELRILSLPFSKALEILFTSHMTSAADTYLGLRYQIQTEQIESTVLDTWNLK
jgi:hypothetical protein